jgi:lysyl-tRNA synthetase, class II
VRHNPEFTMLEFYQAYATYEDLMDLTEEMISTMVLTLFGTTSITFNGRQIDFARPWKRITMEQALIEYGGFGPGAVDDKGALTASGRELGIEGIEKMPKVS